MRQKLFDMSPPLYFLIHIARIGTLPDYDEFDFAVGSEGGRHRCTANEKKNEIVIEAATLTEGSVFGIRFPSCLRQQRQDKSACFA